MVVRMLLVVVLAASGWWAWVRTRAALGRPAPTRAPRRRRLPKVPGALRGGGPAWVVFTNPSQRPPPGVESVLAEHRPSDRVVIVDATRDPELAARWDILRTPTTLRAEADGTVSARFVGTEELRRHLTGSGGGQDSEPLGG